MRFAVKQMHEIVCDNYTNYLPWNARNFRLADRNALERRQQNLHAVPLAWSQT